MKATNLTTSKLPITSPFWWKSVDAFVFLSKRATKDLWHHHQRCMYSVSLGWYLRYYNDDVLSSRSLLWQCYFKRNISCIFLSKFLIENDICTRKQVFNIISQNITGMISHALTRTGLANINLMDVICFHVLPKIGSYMLMIWYADLVLPLLQFMW